MTFPIRSAKIFLTCVSLVFVILALTSCSDSEKTEDSGKAAGWPAYGNDAGGQRHSPLDQITPENVGALEVAWTQPDPITF